MYNRVFNSGAARLLLQVLALGLGSEEGRAYSMLYVGTEAGLFTGYFDQKVRVSTRVVHPPVALIPIATC